MRCLVRTFQVFVRASASLRLLNATKDLLPLGEGEDVVGDDEVEWTNLEFEVEDRGHNDSPSEGRSRGRNRETAETRTCYKKNQDRIISITAFSYFLFALRHKLRSPPNRRSLRPPARFRRVRCILPASWTVHQSIALRYFRLSFSSKVLSSLSLLVVFPSSSIDTPFSFLHIPLSSLPSYHHTHFTITAGLPNALAQEPHSPPGLRRYLHINEPLLQSSRSANRKRPYPHHEGGLSLNIKASRLRFLFLIHKHPSEASQLQP